MDYVDELEQDSGMESSSLHGNSSKDDTPERKSVGGLKLSKEFEVPEINVLISPIESPKAASAQGNPTKAMESIEENYDDEPDETIAERLWGLTEMFPDNVRSVTSSVCSTTWSGVKSFYSYSRTVTWVVATSSVILFAPVLFELERAKMDEMQKTQQKQFLLGPNAAMLGAGSLPPPIPR